VAISVVDLPVLPGEFALQTYHGPFVTAVDGGGRTSDAIHTDATRVRGWELFRLRVVPMQNGSSYAFETRDTGHVLTAVNGGGLSSNAIQSDRYQVDSWETFFLQDQHHPFLHTTAIQTATANYVTAIGAGATFPGTFHTDARQPSTWEWFHFVKCGDLGSGYQYALSHPSMGPLVARGGGGQTTNALTFDHNAPVNHQRFRFIRQDDGSYALQTFDGHYLTAVNGGGLVKGSPSDPDIFQTNRTQVGSWEKFRMAQINVNSYILLTSSGFYVEGVTSTRRGDINYGTQWTLTMFDL
jgi:hypothetical protein